MTRSFSARLTAHFVVTLGGLMAAVILAASCVLFFVHISALNAEMSAAAARVPELLRVYHVAAGDTRSAARVVAGELGQPDLYISASAGMSRFVALPRRAPGAPRVYGLVRTEPEFHRTPFGTLVFALGNAFGLREAHAQIDTLTVTFAADEGALAATVGRCAIEIACLLVAIGLFAWFAACRLAREALRPLNEVVAALESFAAGDLLPQRVEPHPAEAEFRRLAAAYNGAAERVTASFGERDRAEAQIRRFSADAAHQLRTPLTVVQGFIGILAAGRLRTESDRARILQMMDRQSRLMASLIDKLLLLGSWDDQPMQPRLVDVGACVRDLVAPLAAAYPDREFALSIEPACYAYVDASELKTAVTNVVDNALKYAVPEPISVAVRSEDDAAIIVVADRGPGIPEDERERAFERFYRGSKRSVTGSGLGLSIAKRAAERAGGRIAIEGVIPGGTAVRIVLPRAAPTTAELASVDSLE